MKKFVLLLLTAGCCFGQFTSVSFYGGSFLSWGSGSTSSTVGPTADPNAVYQEYYITTNYTQTYAYTSGTGTCQYNSKCGNCRATAIPVTSAGTQACNSVATIKSWMTLYGATDLVSSSVASTPGTYGPVYVSYQDDEYCQTFDGSTTPAGVNSTFTQHIQVNNQEVDYVQFGGIPGGPPTSNGNAAFVGHAGGGYANCNANPLYSIAGTTNPGYKNLNYCSGGWVFAKFGQGGGMSGCVPIN